MTSDVVQSGAGQPEQSNLAVVIAPHLPFLRRFGRALCGSQESGDAYVAATLEALIADRTAIDQSLAPRIGLYRLFLGIWSSAQDSMGDSVGATQDRDGPVAHLAPEPRQILLLTTVEEFSLDEAARVLDIGRSEAESLLSAARDELSGQTRARVMIIEDEPIIALDLESIVTGMGHSVVGIADTHARAVALAAEASPDVILADIQLADGSSGIEAVEEILGSMTVPVIFITAFPERLLTGERPEPTFLITKPFRPETVEASISQVIHHRDTD